MTIYRYWSRRYDVLIDPTAAVSMPQMTMIPRVCPKARQYVNEVLDFGFHNGSMGCDCGDFDNDGDIDIVILNSRREPTILRNDSANQNHWLG